MIHPVFRVTAIGFREFVVDLQKINTTIGLPVRGELTMELTSLFDIIISRLGPTGNMQTKSIILIMSVTIGT